MKLSVALAVYNEEAMLSECLESIKDIADEIVLVDGGSTDGTVRIAKSFGAKVIKTTNPKMFHINKQKALEACKGEWILQLDADERVSKELSKEIKHIVDGKVPEKIDEYKQKLFTLHEQNIEQRDGSLGTKKGEVVAYFIPRLNYFLGGYLRHGGVYPDGVIRLIRNGKAFFPCKSVHEQMKIDGKVSWLSHDLIHVGDPTFSRYLQRANRYTTLTALEYKKEHLKLNMINTLTYMFIKPITTTFLLFIRHKGFMDGIPGFVFALFSGLHFSLAYMKYWEMEHGK